MADYWLEHVDSAVAKLASFSFPTTKIEEELIEEFKKSPGSRKKELPTDPELLHQFWLKREASQGR